MEADITLRKMGLKAPENSSYVPAKRKRRDIQVDIAAGMKYINDCSAAGEPHDVMILGSRLFNCSTSVMCIGKILYSMSFYERHWQGEKP